MRVGKKADRETAFSLPDPVRGEGEGVKEQTIDAVVAAMREEAKRNNEGSLQASLLYRYAKAVEEASANDLTIARALKNEFAKRRRERWIRRAVAIVSVAIVAHFVADYQSRRLAGFVTCAPGYFDHLVGDYAVCSTSNPWPTLSVVPLERKR